MARTPLTAALARVTDSNGNPVSGGVAEFFRAGTSTAISVYGDPTTNTPLGSSVTADAAGLLPDIFIPADFAYKVVYKNASGVELDTKDNISFAADGDASGIVAEYDDYDAMRAVPAPATKQLALVGGDRGGLFEFLTGDQSSLVSADEVTSANGDGGVYVAPTNAPTGASGAWKRIVSGDEITPAMYGATGAAGEHAITQHTINRGRALGYKTVINQDFQHNGDCVSDVDGDCHIVFTGGAKITQSSREAVSAIKIVPRGYNVTIDTPKLRGPHDVDNFTVTDGTVGANQIALFNYGILVQGTQASKGKTVRIINADVDGFAQNIIAQWCETVLPGVPITTNAAYALIMTQDCDRTIPAAGGFASTCKPGFGGTAPYLNAYGVFFTSSETGTGQQHGPVVLDGWIIKDVPTWQGLDTHGGARWMISNCVVTGCANALNVVPLSGVAAADAGDVTCVGCYFEGNVGGTGEVRTGVEWNPRATGQTSATLTMIGCTVKKFGGTLVGSNWTGGLRADNCKGVRLLGCTFEDNVGRNVTLNDCEDFTSDPSCFFGLPAEVDEGGTDRQSHIRVETDDCRGYVAGKFEMSTDSGENPILLDVPASAAAAGYGLRLDRDIQITEDDYGQVYSGSNQVNRIYERTPDIGIHFLASAHFDASGGTIANAQGVNVNALTRNGTGDYTVTVDGDGPSDAQTLWLVEAGGQTAVTSGTHQVCRFLTKSGTGSLADVNDISVVALVTGNFELDRI